MRIFQLNKQKCTRTIENEVSQQDEENETLLKSIRYDSVDDFNAGGIVMGGRA